MAKKNINYQAKKRELETIMAWFENDDVQIDEALAKYQQAAALINELEAYLKDTKAKIEQFVKKANTKSNQ